jgi:hypothetical protein
MSDQEPQDASQEPQDAPDDWAEAVRRQAQADFQREAVAGEAEDTLADVEARIAELQAEHSEVLASGDMNRRIVVENELQTLGMKLADLRAELPFLGLADDQLETLVEDRTIAREELWLKIQAAQDSRILTSPTRLARMERQHQEAGRAEAEAQVALKNRKLVQRGLRDAEYLAEKKRLNDATEAEQAERRRVARDPRAQLDAQIRNTQRIREALDQDRDRALEKLRDGGIGEL